MEIFVTPNSQEELSASDQSVRHTGMSLHHVYERSPPRVPSNPIRRSDILAGINIREEAERIQRKESRLSAVVRRAVLQRYNQDYAAVGER